MPIFNVPADIIGKWELSSSNDEFATAFFIVRPDGTGEMESGVQFTWIINDDSEFVVTTKNNVQKLKLIKLTAYEYESKNESTGSWFKYNKVIE